MGVLDHDPPRKPESEDLSEREATCISERNMCVVILEMCAEAMHGSICAVVGTKYYPAVHRSCL